MLATFDLLIAPEVLRGHTACESPEPLSRPTADSTPRPRCPPSQLFVGAVVWVLGRSVAAPLAAAYMSSLGTTLPKRLTLVVEAERADELDKTSALVDQITF